MKSQNHYLYNMYIQIKFKTEVKKKKKKELKEDKLESWTLLELYIYIYISFYSPIKKKKRKWIPVSSTGKISDG